MDIRRGVALEEDRQDILRKLVAAEMKAFRAHLRNEAHHAHESRKHKLWLQWEYLHKLSVAALLCEVGVQPGMPLHFLSPDAAEGILRGYEQKATAKHPMAGFDTMHQVDKDSFFIPDGPITKQ